MALTLRKTDLATVPVFAHLADWTVFDDDQPIGRIYEEHPPSRAELAWSWSIPRARVAISGRAANLADAKADFAASWDAWKAWEATVGR